VDEKKIFHKLRRVYGIKPKHILILSALKDATPRSAHKIAQLTNIPLGRLYTFLNELTSFHLVQRTGKKPYAYFIENFNTAVIDFMRSQMNKYITAESEIIELMKGGAPEHIELIKSKKDYTHAHLKLIEESSKIRITCYHRSYPFILYPSNFDDFLLLRKAVVAWRPTISFVDPDALYIIFSTYQKAIDAGKEFEVICEKWTLLDHLEMIKKELGEEFYERYVKEMSDRLRKKKISVRALEEYLPMEIDLGDTNVVLAINHLNVSTGSVIRSPVVLDLYSTLFDQKLPRTKNLMEYLED
jgi:hypothetical protein